MRRLKLVLGGVLFATVLSVGTATAVSAASGDSCVSAAAATYQHSFDGAAGHATVTAVQALCEGEEQVFSLASYTEVDGSRFVYDSASAWISSERDSVTLTVDVPGCRTRVEALTGAAVPAETTTGAVDGGWDAYAGGVDACAPSPVVRFESYCDGVLHTGLANAAGANVDAVFVVDGRRVRVRPGEEKDLISRPTGTVEVRDSTHAISTGAWSNPADCTPLVE